MMRRHYTSAAAAMALFAAAPTIVQAFPSFGYTCVACHGTSAADGYNDSRLTILNPSGTVNPVERPGAIDRGTLPFFQVLPGSGVLLQLKTTGTISHPYGFLTDNYQKPGVVGGGSINITPDATWTLQTNASGNFWYRTSFNGGTQTLTYSHNLTVPAGTPADFYEFEMGWGGSGGNDAGLKRFYLRVLAPTPGEWANPAGGNWTGLLNWTSVVPNGDGATANFLGAINADAAVTLDNPRIVGAVNFGNVNRYSLNGPGELGFRSTGSGVSTINVSLGSHTIAAPIAFENNMVVTVTPPASTLTLSGHVTPTAVVGLDKAGAGTLSLTDPPTWTGPTNVLAGVLATEAGSIGALSVSDGATALVAAPTGSAALRVTSLSVAANGRVDVGGDGLAVAGGSLPAVRGLLASGYAGGAWNGPGIDSSAAAASAGRGAVGCGLASDVLGLVAPNTGVFLGKTVAADDVLVRYTLGGDATLDGAVNIADFSRLGANFNQPGGWSSGDFNYDGTVGIADFSLLGANFNQSVSTGVADASAVPEPAIGILILAGLLVRRRGGVS